MSLPLDCKLLEHRAGPSCYSFLYCRALALVHKKLLVSIYLSCWIGLKLALNPGLKLNIEKTKIMAPGPITSWQIDGETVADFIFLGSKITADDGCSHEIKRCLLLGRKVMTNLDSILKIRDITLSTKVLLVKSMVFPVSCMDVRVRS